MVKIIGKHAIQAACSNPLRIKKVFHGDKSVYNSLLLKCPYQHSRDNFLEADEWYVSSSLDQIVQRDRIILLDSLEDPHNLGSIIRSAAILGYGVILRNHKGCTINQTVLKCAAGGVDNTNIISVSNIQEALNYIKKAGFWVYGLSENGVLNVQKNNKILIVVGAEGSGIKTLTKKNCDYFIKLKGHSHFNIYNASVAAAIAMYQFE